MYNEIERRFLVKAPLEKIVEMAVESYNIKQGYLDSEKCKISFIEMECKSNGEFIYFILIDTFPIMLTIPIFKEDFEYIINVQSNCITFENFTDEYQSKKANLNSNNGRVRIKSNILNGETEYYLTLKFSNTVGVIELEYAITQNQADILMDKCKGTILIKNRYLTKEGFEIDYYIEPECFSAYIIAEKELSDINEELDIPEWCGTEITNFKNISNKNISIDPSSCLIVIDSLSMYNGE